MWTRIGPTVGLQSDSPVCLLSFSKNTISSKTSPLLVDLPYILTIYPSTEDVRIRCPVQNTIQIPEWYPCEKQQKQPSSCCFTSVSTPKMKYFSDAWQSRQLPPYRQNAFSQTCMGTTADSRTDYKRDIRPGDSVHVPSCPRIYCMPGMAVGDSCEMRHHAYNIARLWLIQAVVIIDTYLLRGNAQRTFPANGRVDRRQSDSFVHHNVPRLKCDWRDGDLILEVSRVINSSNAHIIQHPAANDHRTVLCCINSTGNGVAANDMNHNWVPNVSGKTSDLAPSFRTSRTR